VTRLVRALVITAVSLGLGACPGTLTDPDLILAARAASVCDAPAQVFASRCSGCHSAGSGQYANLDLISPDVAKRTSKVAATCPGEVLVVPGFPDASYLYDKLVNPSPACGSLMPLGGSLSSDDLACVASWIVGLGSGGPPPDLSCGDNLDAAKALPISSDPVAGCIATNGDERHFFSVTAPSEGGGTLVVTVDDAGAGTLEAQVLFPGPEAGEIAHVTAYEPGAAIGLFFAAAPGQTYWVSVFQVVTTSAPFLYTLQATYAPSADPSFGHAAAQDALSIEVGTPVSAGFFAGYTSAAPPLPADFGAWFQVSLQARPMAVSLQGCPADVQAQIDLTDATGSSVLATAAADGDGLDVDLDAGIATAGTYLIHAYPSAPPRDPPGGTGTSQTAYFDQAYTLTVSQ